MTLLFGFSPLVAVTRTPKPCWIKKWWVLPRRCYYPVPCPLIYSCCGARLRDIKSIADLLCGINSGIPVPHKAGFPWIFVGFSPYDMVLSDFLLGLVFLLGPILTLFWVCLSEVLILSSSLTVYILLLRSPQRQAWVMFQEYGVSWPKQVMSRKAMTWGLLAIGSNPLLSHTSLPWMLPSAWIMPKFEFWAICYSSLVTLCKHRIASPYFLFQSWLPTGIRAYHLAEPI